MAISVFKHNKIDFISGLFWQSLNDPDRPKDEIASLAKQLEQGLFVYKKGAVSNTNQAGFASALEGALAGQYSLAVAVSRRVLMKDGPRKWMACVPLPTGLYNYIASVDDTFLANGDVVGSLEEVEELMRQDYSLTDWDKIYAPSELSFEGAEVITFEDMLPKKGASGKYDLNSSMKLTEVKRSIPWKKIGIGAFVVIAGYVGYVEFKKYITEKEQAEMQAKIAQARAMLTQQQQQVKIVTPWSTMPNGQQFLDRCLAHFTTEKFYPGGWAITDFKCKGDKIEYTWDRGQSDIESLVAYMPEAFVEESGNRAIYGFNAQPVIQLFDEELMPNKEAVYHFKSQFQRFGIQLEFSKINAQPDPAGNMPKWNTYKFKYSTTIPPTTGAIDFMMPGLRITGIEYSPAQTGAWVIEGDLYTLI